MEAVEDPLVVNEVLEPLCTYSLIRVGVDQTYSIHRLVQEVVKADIDEESHRLWAERTIAAITKAFPDAKYENWLLCEGSPLRTVEVVILGRKFR